ncbi:MAG: cytochrome c3 family protein [Thermoguttaceae bacterium]
MGNRLIRPALLCLPVIVLACVLPGTQARLSGAAPAEQGKPAAVPAPDEEPKPSPGDDPPAAEAAEEPPTIDPMGPNSACYVCHTTFVFEELAKSHLVEKITCIECHGLSAAHANDENIGATKPDITYPRDKIDASCLKCHEEHDVAARDVIARFLERELKDPKPLCTDCHGAHKIERVDEESAVGPAAPSKDSPKMPGK